MRVPGRGNTIPNNVMRVTCDRKNPRNPAATPEPGRAAGGASTPGNPGRPELPHGSRAKDQGPERCQEDDGPVHRTIGRDPDGDEEMASAPPTCLFACLLTLGIIIQA